MYTVLHQIHGSHARYHFAHWHQTVSFFSKMPKSYFGSSCESSVTCRDLGDLTSQGIPRMWPSVLFVLCQENHRHVSLLFYTNMPCGAWGHTYLKPWILQLGSKYVVFCTSTWHNCPLQHMMLTFFIPGQSLTAGSKLQASWSEISHKLNLKQYSTFLKRVFSNKQHKLMQGSCMLVSVDLKQAAGFNSSVTELYRYW